MCQRLAFLPLAVLTLQTVFAQYPGNYNDYGSGPVPFSGLSYAVQHAAPANRATPAHSIWSGAPIVVAYAPQDASATEQTHAYGAANPSDHIARQSHRLTPAYLPTNLYNALSTLPFERDEADANSIPTQAANQPRAANHNYDTAAQFYDFDYRRRQAAIDSVYNSRAKPSPVLWPGTMHTNAQRSSASAHAYGRADAGRYYEPPLPLLYAAREPPQATGAAKYAAHFQEYLRKNPQRLQPIFDTNQLQK